MPNVSNPAGRDELDSLLSELLDARDPLVIGKLEALLKDNPALQDEYIRYLSMHSLLNVEWNTLGAPLESLCASEASKLLPAFQEAGAGSRTRRRTSFSGAGWSQDAAESPLSLIARKLLRLVWFPVRAPSPVAIASVMLAALAAGAMGGAIVAYSLDRVWWSHSGANYTKEQVDAAERWLNAKRTEQGAQLGHFPAASAGLWAEVKPVIDPSRFQKGQLTPGAIQLEPFNGVEGEGYLLALPPGHGVELLVDVESVKENALIVKRMDADGVLTGHSLSFNNHDVDTQPRSSWRVGRIGYWVDFNEYDQTRYYLICGVSKGPNYADGGKWVYSQFQPLTVSRDLIFLGWDDGAVSGVPESPGVTFEADNDFNDVSAILRIRRPQHVDLTDKPQIVTAPDREVSEEAISIPADSYALQVEPGQSVLIQVSFPAGEPCALDIVNAHNGERWWRHVEQKGKDKLGLYSIDNRTDDPLDLCFVGHPGLTEPGEAGGKKTSPLVHEVRASDADYCEIGYEDADIIAGDEDPGFDKIRIRVHRIQ